MAKNKMIAMEVKIFKDIDQNRSVEYGRKLSLDCHDNWYRLWKKN